MPVNLTDLPILTKPSTAVVSSLEVAARASGHFWTAQDLMNTPFPEPRWAVPGLVAEGITLMAGAPKFGKSWLCLNLAVAVATGGRALGKIDVEQGAVLYAALEDTGRRLQDRLSLVLSGQDGPCDLALLTALPPLHLAIEELKGWALATPSARLIIIDVLRKIRPQANAQTSAYDADYAVMGSLKRLAEETGVAVMVVHHTRKMADEQDVFNEVSGSTGLTGAADAILVVKRARNTAEAVLNVTGRDVAEHQYGIAWQGDSHCWTLLDEPPGGATGNRRVIADYLREVTGATPTEIAEQTGMNRNTAKVTVRRMVEDRQLDTDGNGHYFLPVEA